MGGDGYTLDTANLRRAMRRYRDRLAEHRAALDRLNVFPVPDGDTGTNMVLTVDAVVAETDRAASLDEFSAALNGASLAGAGNSGLILSEILRALAGAVAGRDGGVASPDLAAGLAEARHAAYRCVGRPVEGTILTVLSASAAAAGDDGEPERLDLFLGRVYAAAADALAATPTLLPALAEAGVVDAGGAGYLLLLAALLEEVTGAPVALPDGTLDPAARSPAPRPGAPGPRHGLMLLLDGPEGAGDALRRAWAGHGESIVVVGGDGTWACHVHTDDVDGALDEARAHGRTHRIVIHDLAEQVETEAARRTGRPARRRRWRR